MSQFDPSTLLNASYEESLDSRYTPVPEGEFNAVVSKVEIREVSTKNGPGMVLDVTWKIDDDGVREATSLAEPSVRQGIFLDLTSSGGLDFSKGKNIRLGALREALGQNEPGKPWTFNSLVGQVAKVQVKHRVSDDGNVNADVKRVAAL